MLIHKLCDYGCGHSAHYQFKNGKWCCEPMVQKCPNFKPWNKGKKNCYNEEIRNKIRKSLTGKQHTEETRKKISCGNRGKKQTEYQKEIVRRYMKNRKISDETRKKMSESFKGRIPWNKGKSGCFSKESINKMSLSSKGNIPWNKGLKIPEISGPNHPMYGKTHTKEVIKKISDSGKHTLKSLTELYPTFVLVEKPRENRKGDVEFQCKFCKKWFVPDCFSRNYRIQAVEDENRNGGAYLYCSIECKQKCPSYRYNPSFDHPEKDITDFFTESELSIWSQEVLSRDNHTCQYCGSTENLHAHHVKPKKLFPYEALDPDNGITFCQECHYKIGHKGECSTYNLAIRNCKKEKNEND